MKILHVIPSVALIHGGPSQAISMFEKACSLNDICVETVTTDDDGPGKRIDISKPNDPEGRPTIRHYLRKNSEFYKVSFPLAIWLWRNIRHYDVVHIHALFSFSSTAATLIARIRKVPYIIRPLGTLNDYGRLQRRPWLKNMSIRFIEAPALRNAAAVHFTSLAELEEAKNIAVSMKPVVLPLAVNPTSANDAFDLTLKFPLLKGSPYILFMSRLDPKKNIEGLLQALAELQKSSTETFKCVIAGDGSPSYVVSLKQIASDNGIADQVIWAGHLQADEKYAALAGAALFVLPSYSENFGIAAAEALSAGLPCILSRGVALAAEAQAAGAAIEVGTDPDSIAAAIILLLKNTVMRNEMGKRAKDFADSQYSLAAMGKGLHKLYDDILQNTRHRAIQ